MASKAEQKQSALKKDSSVKLTKQKSRVINCKCGITIDNDKPTIQCTVCLSWSHMSCAHLTKRTAAKTSFVYHVCSAIHPNSNTISPSNPLEPIDVTPSKDEASSIPLSLNQLKEVIDSLLRKLLMLYSPQLIFKLSLSIHTYSLLEMSV